MSTMLYSLPRSIRYAATVTATTGKAIRIPHAIHTLRAASANQSQKLRPRTAAMPPIWIIRASQLTKDTAAMYQTKLVISPVSIIVCHAIILETMNAIAVMIIIVVRIVLVPFVC